MPPSKSYLLAVSSTVLLTLTLNSYRFVATPTLVLTYVPELPCGECS